ncbi:Protein OS-9 [Paraconiothyrium brasiliense]|uniref:Endoplasmic reticulum lectin n=1 Tax=Paraconiothyrium brasiliense TaxID=300254 RepID=A0ABR3RI54_9PLEO
MRNFWALPAFLRIALASPHSFSVFEDLLAFPQYEIVFPDEYVTENEATSLLSQSLSRSTSSATPISQATQDLSKPGKQPSDPPHRDDELDLTYERVVLDGRRYLCSIPVFPEDVPQNSTVSPEEAKAEEEKELVRASSRGGELLDGMKGECIYYLSGWWSYAFCYKDHVKQFHQLPPGRGGAPIYPPVEDHAVNSFILGRFSEKDKEKKSEERKTLGSEQEARDLDDEGNAKQGTADTESKQETGLDLPRLETKGSSRYMVQRLAGGTECDLTGRERKIEVQFHCNPQPMDKIAMIKEISTCSYLMIIYTPRLCNDIAFQPPQENLAHPITCQPVLAPSEVDEWDLARLEDKVAQSELLASLAAYEAQNPLREMAPGLDGSTKRGPIIGGIEVGAQSLVGSEGKVIEKGIIAGGGKETFLGTLITSDGKMMSKEELKKVGMEVRDVEKLERNSKKIAGKKEWRLDLIETPQGQREYRLIEFIEPDEEKEGKKGKGKGEEEKEKPKGMSSSDKEAAEADAGEQGDAQEGSEEVYKDEL